MRNLLRYLASILQALRHSVTLSLRGGVPVEELDRILEEAVAKYAEKHWRSFRHDKQFLEKMMENTEKIEKAVYSAATKLPQSRGVISFCWWPPRGLWTEHCVEVFWRKKNGKVVVDKVWIGSTQHPRGIVVSFLKPESVEEVDFLTELEVKNYIRELMRRYKLSSPEELKKYAWLYFD